MPLLRASSANDGGGIFSRITSGNPIVTSGGNSLTGGVGFRYVLETSSDLNTWTPWITVTNDARTLDLLDFPFSGTNVQSRFYRAVMR